MSYLYNSPSTITYASTSNLFSDKALTSKESNSESMIPISKGIDVGANENYSNGKDKRNGTIINYSPTSSKSNSSYSSSCSPSLSSSEEEACTKLETETTMEEDY